MDNSVPGVGNLNSLTNVLLTSSFSAMVAILRDRINDLLTANADLEREVARLRYADAARGAAESVETLNKLRKTRDTLNDIVTENDQLKIEVDIFMEFFVLTLDLLLLLKLTS